MFDLLPEHMRNKSTAKETLRKLTKHLCKMIRDNYGHINPEIVSHMRYVIAGTKLSIFGGILIETYKDYLIPVSAEVFKRDITFFKELDRSQYFDAADGDAKYVNFIFDIFTECYDVMTDIHRHLLWQSLENAILICNSYDDL